MHCLLLLKFGIVVYDPRDLSRLAVQCCSLHKHLNE